MRAVDVSAACTGAPAETDVEMTVLLLFDIRALFLATGASRMTSADIAARLAVMEGRPWAAWKRGRPMSAVRLARALASFGVRPGTVRVGAATAKGYYRETIEDAWWRSPPADAAPLPQAMGSETSQRHTTDCETSHRHTPAATGVSGQPGAGEAAGGQGGSPARRALQGAEAPIIDAAPASAAPVPDDAGALDRVMLNGHRRTDARLPPSWGPATMVPVPGASCMCCSGRRWWSERPDPQGWRCAACYPPRLAAEAIAMVER